MGQLSGYSYRDIVQRLIFRLFLPSANGRKSSKPRPEMADYAPTVRKILSESGCRLERQGKGDHEIWYSPLTKLRFPVDGKIRSRHTGPVCN